MNEKNVIKIQSDYLQCEVSVGEGIPTQAERFLILLHGYNGSFKHLKENLPLMKYANRNDVVIVTPDMNNGYYMDKPNYSVSEFLLFELVPYIFDRYGFKEEIPMYLAGISMGDTAVC